MQFSVEMKAFAKGAFAVRTKVHGPRGAVANGPAEFDDAREQRRADCAGQVMPPLAPVHAESAGRPSSAAYESCSGTRFGDQALARRAECGSRVVEIDCRPLEQARIQKQTDVGCELVIADPRIAERHVSPTRCVGTSS